MQKFCTSLTKTPAKSIIFGAGGFASEVLAEMSHLPHLPRVSAFVVDVPQPQTHFKDLPILPLESQIGQKIICANIAVGDPLIRSDIARKIQSKSIEEVDYLKIISKDITLHPSVSVGKGTILCQGVIPTIDIDIGKHVHININSTIGHGTKIGDFVTISPGVDIAGNVIIEDSVFIGIGATIINGSSSKPLVIGKQSIIAAGSVVTKSVPSRTMVAGVPAIIKKQF